jgi:hypothetical protein
MCTGVGNCKTHQFLLRPLLWHWNVPVSELVTDCRHQTTGGFYVTRAVPAGGGGAEVWRRVFMQPFMRDY